MYFPVVYLSLFFGVAVQAHMRLNSPAPLKAPNNPHTQGQPDEDLTYPYNCCGNFDTEFCHGHLDVLDTPEGASVETWTAGSSATFSLSGDANHWGGSCQVGFSTDNGKTFKVATSFEGNCPLRNSGTDPSNQSFDFEVPADLPAGDAIFAWTWVNREQEFNMNCAAVTIENSNAAQNIKNDTSYVLNDCSCNCESASITDSGVYDASNCQCECSDSSSSRSLRHKHTQSRHGHLYKRKEGVAFSERPNMLMVDDGNGCVSPGDHAELMYPEPGPDVVEGDGVYPLELPFPLEKC